MALPCLCAGAGDMCSLKRAKPVPDHHRCVYLPQGHIAKDYSDKLPDFRTACPYLCAIR
jgi:hypothetical protein